MIRLGLCVFLVALAGCASGPHIDTRYTSKSQDSRAQFLIIHYTAGGFQGSLKWLTEGPVSSHYLVNDNPVAIYGLVDDSRRAYHAGVSYWKGNTQLNASSIGIEIVNLGSKKTPDGTQWFEFPSAQIDAVIALVKKIVKEHGITPDRVLAHSDIAPQRKPDPGPRFPWKRLADEGLVQWPDAAQVALRRPAFEAQLPDVEWFQRNLSAHGFLVPLSGELDKETRNVLAAFQMKYRPANFDGTPDAETATLLDVLNSVLIGGSVNAQPTPPRQVQTESMSWATLDTELAAITNDAARPLASLSVLAVRGGEVVYQKQFGHRYIGAKDAANNKLANDLTMYRMASISKLVTTLGVMKLMEAGELKLDTDVSEYLGYKLRNPNFPDDPITLRMLLSHTSSLRDDAGYYWEAKLNVDLKEVLLPGGRLFGKGQAWASNAKPGAYFQYANFPWGVIGTIMERVNRERFDRLMRRLILDPMDLRGGFHPADFSRADLDNTATLYRKRTEVNGKEIWNPAGPWVVQVDDYVTEAPVPRAFADYKMGTNGTLFGPQGNCRLSAAGLGKIMLMLMNDGKLDGKPILQKASVDLMLAQQWRFDAKLKNGSNGYGGHQDAMNAWGFGNQQFLDISGAGSGDRLVESGFKAQGHLGDAWGLTSAMVFDRDKKEGMIFLVGGPGFDPETDGGKYSAHYRYEEKILTALYRHAIANGR